MKAPLILRMFEPEDIDAVIDLLQDVSAYRPAADAVPVLSETFSVQPDCYACVAMQEGRLVAFGSVFILNRVRGGRSSVIEDVVVAADLRGQGVGQQIVKALVEAARARGCFKVSLEAAASARPFYKACGFSAAGQTMKILL